MDVHYEQNPSARTEDLLVEKLDGELLVYDCASDTAHVLEPRVAAIWEACDGTAPVPELASHADVDEDFVYAALDRLHDISLLRRDAAGEPAHTRRSVLRRGAMVGAAGIAAAPIIHSIVAPTAASAGGSCVPDGGPCTAGTPGVCCSETCCVSLSPFPPNTCCSPGSAKVNERGRVARAH